MCCTRKLTGFILFLAILAEAGLVYWLKFDAPVGFLGWVETEDAAPYYGPAAPVPPYKIDLDSKDSIIKAVDESHALSAPSSDFGRLVALRNWTRGQCSTIVPRFNVETPGETLSAFKRGEGGACGSLSYLYCAALLAYDYRARLVQLIRDPADVPRWVEGPLDTHVTVEVFSKDNQKWIVMDPFFNCWFHKPGSSEPLSARDLELIAANPGVDTTQNGPISLVRAGVVVAETDGFDTSPKVDTYYIDPILMFRNAFLLYYDVFSPPVKSPVQKYTKLLEARFLGTEKVVWLLAPGQKPDYMATFEIAANWIPLGVLLLLVLMLAQSGPRRVEEEEESQEEDEEE